MSSAPLATIEQQLAARINDTIGRLWPESAHLVPNPEVAVPREAGHGDYSTNAAMLLAKALKKNPREFAGALAEELKKSDDLLDGVEVAGPGFINLTLSRTVLNDTLKRVLAEGSAYGCSNAGLGERLQVEFVSANPTGPLNVVNARAAAFGGTLARLFNAAGWKCDTEFYVNDVGTQIDLLGQSLLARYRESKGGGPAVIPENGYQGLYLADIAGELKGPDVDAALAKPNDTAIAADFSKIATARIRAWQKGDLARYGTEFDRWYLQSELYPEAVQKTLAFIKERGYVVEKDGAQWLATTRFGDDQDRVLVRQTGEPTYFLADIAYHVDKHNRGYAHVIDIWGPDHHGHIPRMQAGMEILGYGRDWLEVIIVQQVNLLSAGQPVKMSKRAGELVTLSDLVDDVGKDTAIFFFLMRRASSHLDFDLDVARKTSDENPVYYVKYAHARIASLLRKAVESSQPGANDPAAGESSLLTHSTELDLMRLITRLPEVIVGGARHREPHRLTNYLREVASAFHPFYHQCRVVGEEPKLAHARLLLCAAVKQVLANGMALINVDAPESM
ncbi:MAG TPA: arginine--tRNA ligase [Candidatus Eisenbacteria bacterium]